MRWLVVALMLFAIPSCVRVRAHQRESLARRSMTDDKSKSEARFGGHERGAREGADGGTGQPGGGCGCN